MTTMTVTVPPAHKPNLASADIVSEAKELFGDNTYLRVIHYCREATLWGRSRMDLQLSPRSISPFMIGHAGYGKTSNMREYARTAGINYIERVISGTNDIAEVFGMVSSERNHVTGEMETTLAKPAWWPKPGTTGMICWDDWTRAGTAIISSVMMLSDGDSVNDLKLPEGWTCSFTGNPEDEYNVTSLDEAQMSRALIIPYNRTNESFFRQLEVQDVHPELKNLWTKDRAQVDAPPCNPPHPKNNDRVKMIYARIFPMLRLDDEANTLVSTAMFGPGWLPAFKVSQSEMQPPEPTEILNDYETVKSRIHEAVEMQRTDIIASMTFRLIAYMSSRQPTDFTDDNYRNFEKFAVMMPPSDINRLVTNLSSFATPISLATQVKNLDGSVKSNGAYSLKAAEIMKEARTRSM